MECDRDRTIGTVVLF